MGVSIRSPLRRKTNIRTNKKCFNTFSAFVQTLTYFSFLFRKFLRKQGIWWLTWLWHVVLSYTNKNILFFAHLTVNYINSNLLYSIACIYVNCINSNLHQSYHQILQLSRYPKIILQILVHLQVKMLFKLFCSY